MKLIIGLGNPGGEYTRTRHNAGFLVVDFLRAQWNFPEFSLNKKFHAEVSEGLQSGEKILLVKPNTFMNLSGTAVRALVDFYKLTPADILVTQDELDLPLGTYRLAFNSSAAGHNGIKSLIEHLGTQEFRRLRIGIATPEPNAPGPRDAHDFVLGRFTSEEVAALEKCFPLLEQEVVVFLKDKNPE